MIHPAGLGGTDRRADVGGDVETLMYPPPARTVFRCHPVVQWPAHGARRDHHTDRGAVDPGSITVQRPARVVEADSPAAITLGGLEFDHGDPLAENGLDLRLRLLESVDLAVQPADPNLQFGLQCLLAAAGPVGLGKQFGLLARYLVDGTPENLQVLLPLDDLGDAAVETFEQFLVVLADHGQEHMPVLEVVNVRNVPRQCRPVLGDEDVHVHEPLGNQPALLGERCFGSLEGSAGLGVLLGGQCSTSDYVRQPLLEEADQFGGAHHLGLECGRRQPECGDLLTDCAVFDVELRELRPRPLQVRVVGEPFLQVLMVGGVLGADGEGRQEDKQADGTKPRASRHMTFRRSKPLTTGNTSNRTQHDQHIPPESLMARGATVTQRRPQHSVMSCRGFSE